MIINKSVVHLPVKGCRCVFPLVSPAPPEPVSVHFMIRSPQHRHFCIAQLFQEAGNLVDLPCPLIVEISPSCQDIPELLISQPSLDTCQGRCGIGSPNRLKCDGFHGCGRHGMPAKRDEVSVPVLPDGFLYYFMTSKIGILVTFSRKTEILAPHRRSFSYKAGSEIRIPRTRVRKVMLACKYMLPANCVKVFQQSPCLG